MLIEADERALLGGIFHSGQNAEALGSVRAVGGGWLAGLAADSLVVVVVVDWVLEAVGGAAEVHGVDAVAPAERDDVDVMVVAAVLDLAQRADGYEYALALGEDALLVDGEADVCGGESAA